MRIHRRVILCFVLAPMLGWAGGEGVPVVIGNRSAATIVVGDNAGQLARWAAGELPRYIEKLSGARLEIVTPSQLLSRPADGNLILIGGPNQNETVRELQKAGRVDFENLKAEGFVLKTLRRGNRPAVVVGGNDDAGTMYAVYELIKRLGVTFRLTGDVVPASQPNLSIPELDLRLEPAFPRRGFLLALCFDNISAFSYQDYELFLDQMAKMKTNYLQFWWFPNAPWLKYSYQGEDKWMGDVSQKESGYHTWTYGGFGSRTVDDVSIGKQHFQERKWMAPLEMQQVQTPGDAFAAAQNLLQRVIAHAQQRGIKVWLVVELAAFPPNLARYGEIVGMKPFNPIFGTFPHPQDDVNREIQLNRLSALAKTYPEAEGYFLNFSELYPNLATEKHRDFFAQQRPRFHDLRRLSFPWSEVLANLYIVTPDQMVDSNIGYFDLFQYLLGKLDGVMPQGKIGLMTVGRGYALPLFDKLLPKHIPFTTLESSGVWTPTGVPMEYFAGMGERERIIQPRVDDDFDMMGMQFSVRQYALKDRIFVEGIKHGLSGFAGQVERARGTEFNSSYLAEAAWAPELKPKEFYREYSDRMFGQEAAPAMYRAFMVLEDLQAYLGYYNYGLPSYGTLNCCGPLPEVDAAYQYSLQTDPYGGPAGDSWSRFIQKSPEMIHRWEGSVELLNEALNQMKAADRNVASHGQYELHYLINRTEAYRDYMQALITMRRAYLAFDEAFRQKDRIGHAAFMARLNESMGIFQAACAQVRDATQRYSQIVDHVSDLAVLYHLNARAVLGFDLARQWMQNVANYHKGENYLHHVPFERLYSPGVYNVRFRSD